MTVSATIDQNSPAARFEPGSGVAVLLPLALPGVLDYRVGAGQSLRPGDFVRVPLGGREAVGVVWGAPGSEANALRRRDVLRRLDLPPLPEALRRLVDWVAAYTLAEPGMVLKMAMSVPAALEDPGPAPMLVAAAREPVAGLALTGARKAVLALAATAPMAQAELARGAGVGPSVVAGLLAKGALIRVPGLPSMPPGPDWRRSGPALSPDQAAAAAALGAGVEAGFSAQLLDGVTGSGKTEVYFEAIAKALALGRQSLVLLPEIGLSAQWLARFRDRFGADPLVWHSEIGPARRRDGWRAVALGQAPVVVGARSALFLPFPALGLVVVDEEHDASFKQEDGVIYNARDMAVVRARFSDCPVILSSATPSLETRVNAEQGRYRRLILPARHGRAQLPEIGLVDLRRMAPARGSWISPPLADAVEAALGASEQAMLFLNRRGYAPLTLCRACGHRLQCPHCSAWLVEHRQARRLECHHCGYKMAVPKACPACEAEESLVACGPGVERVAEEAAQRFPAARIAVMASDTLGSPAAAAALVERMAAREIDLLIGTQIVAKGHHFPWLTLVGVVDADLGLEGGDLRAAERTFQLLSQVAGRAGRAERPGRVLLQTFQPGHKVMQALASGQAEAFYREEAAERARHFMPPFGRLAALIVSAGSEAGADDACRRLAAAAPVAEMLEILGPAPAPLALLRGRHRRRFLLKAARRVSLQNVVRDWLGPLSFPRDVRIQIDIDPYSFF